MGKKSFRSKRLTEAAKGRACVLCGLTGTTVAAHSNALGDGRGMGMKAPDYFVAYVCHGCHDMIDGRSHAKDLSRRDRRDIWELAWKRTVQIWFEDGIVVVK